MHGYSVGTCVSRVESGEWIAQGCDCQTTRLEWMGAVGWGNGSLMVVMQGHGLWSLPNSEDDDVALEEEENTTVGSSPSVALLKRKCKAFFIKQG